MERIKRKHKKQKFINSKNLFCAYKKRLERVTELKKIILKNLHQISIDNWKKLKEQKQE